MDENKVSLKIGGEVFEVQKDTLCEHSDYFRAMFSGPYVENEKREITIDVVDAESMKIIIKYMELGLIDLMEYSLSTIGDLANTANFLQITELLKQIEYNLDINISVSNWMETMSIAESASFTKLEQLSASYGLYNFKQVKPEHVPSIQKLFWYLSHTYLDASSELEVFKFGLEWINTADTGADALLVILGCLDIKKLTCAEVTEIKTLMRSYDTSLAAKIVDCLHELYISRYEISISHISSQKEILCEMYTERVYNEVIHMVRESKARQNVLIAAVPMWIVKSGKVESIPHNLYTYSENSGFERWLEVGESGLWGWHIVSWGQTKFVIVGGEIGRGTENFVRTVKVYDILKQEWICHGVQLPCRRHGGVDILGDELYIVGGVGEFRVVLDSAVIYDLKDRSYRRIAKLPDKIQTLAVCAHEGVVYASGNKNIYKYEDLGETDRWSSVVETPIRCSCMKSFKGYIYCVQNYFTHFYRFRPGVDNQLELITYFSIPPASICDFGNRLLVFTRTMCTQKDIMAVEEYVNNTEENLPRILWSQSDSRMKYNDISGACTLITAVPTINPEVSQFAKKHLIRYSMPFLESWP